MEDYSFEEDGNEFDCIECKYHIKVEFIEDEPRPMTCPRCETEYKIGKREGGGISVEVITKSLPEPEAQEEEHMEEGD
ncbi:MAG: hypothetical protein HYT73_03500 [Candidatus Aenigmarchaeota archaeon]|nr:hypothetical protein [Candidatus Aenigmarchaeota archaeon]